MNMETRFITGTALMTQFFRFRFELPGIFFFLNLRISDRPNMTILWKSMILNRYINLSTVLESDSFIILRYFFEKSIMLFVDKSTGYSKQPGILMRVD